MNKIKVYKKKSTLHQALFFTFYVLALANSKDVKMAKVSPINGLNN